MNRTTTEGSGRDDSHDWARRDRTGLVRAFLNTTSELITDPGSFFQKVNPSSSFQGSLLYGVIVFVVSMLFSAFWKTAGLLVGIGATGEAFSQLMGIGAVLVMVILSPILAIVLIFLGAGFFHLVLLLFGWSRHPFGATVKVVSFAGVSGLANAIPVCGGLIGFVWGLILLVMGIRELHEASTGQAVIVALAPTLLVLFCACLFVTMIAMGSVV